MKDAIRAWLTRCPATQREYLYRLVRALSLTMDVYLELDPENVYITVLEGKPPFTEIRPGTHRGKYRIVYSFNSGRLLLSTCYWIRAERGMAKTIHSPSLLERIHLESPAKGCLLTPEEESALCIEMFEAKLTLSTQVQELLHSIFED